MQRRAVGHFEGFLSALCSTQQRNTSRFFRSSSLLVTFFFFITLIVVDQSVDISSQSCAAHSAK